MKKPRTSKKGAFTALKENITAIRKKRPTKDEIEQLNKILEKPIK